MIKSSIQRKAMCSVLVVLLLFNLSSCMLFPKEEEERKVSFIKADKLEQYAFISPKRIDMEKYVDIPCSYRQRKEESLKFTVDGQLVEHVYCSAGDTVKKGTLLATLRTVDLEQEIMLLENAIGLMQRQIEQIKLKASYDKKYVELEYENKHIAKEEKEQRILMIEDSLKDELASKEDEKYIQTLRLKEKKEKLAGSRIYAPMDGVIGEIDSELENSYSIEGVEVITIINVEDCAFEIIVSDDTAYLQEGQTYLVDCEGSSYEGTLLHTKKKDSKFIYLQLKESSLNPEVGQRGSIRFLADSRKNTLVLPTSAIHEGKDYHFVYVLSENKVKKIHKVEVGLKTLEYTEILGGLKEEDRVINE